MNTLVRKKHPSPQQVNNQPAEVIVDKTSNLLSVSEIEVAYDRHNILNGLSLAVRQGDIICLLGPSGCGKTTLLRAIAGFCQIDAGFIAIDNHIVGSKAQQLAPERRGVGIVFQDYALFPHLTVKNNIGFGLHKLTNDQRQIRIDELLALTDLQDYAERYPHHLSGGQQQRVALARALAPSPRLLLLDEPFSSIDTERREILALQTRQILKAEGVTTVMVSHDQREAFTLADRIAVMQNGELLQLAASDELYNKPCHRFVASFIGEGVFITGRCDFSAMLVSTELGEVAVRNSQSAAIGQTVEERIENVDVLVRPNDISLQPDSPVQAVLMESVYRGGYYRYTLRLPSGSIVYTLVDNQHANQHDRVQAGDTLGVRLATASLCIFPRQ